MPRGPALAGSRALLGLAGAVQAGQWPKVNSVQPICHGHAGVYRDRILRRDLLVTVSHTAHRGMYAKRAPPPRGWAALLLLACLAAGAFAQSTAPDMSKIRNRLSAKKDLVRSHPRALCPARLARAG